jgi:hypothetical protein
MRFSCWAVLALSACYAPTVLGGAPCEPGRDSCPTGQTCQATGSGNFCLGDGARGDAGADSPVTSTDDGGGSCFGKGLLGSVCLTSAPTATRAFTSATTVNTASVGAGNCSEIHAQAAGASLCIVAGTTITVATGATLRAIGANPLVLIATQSITIGGGLDVSSHAGDTVGGVATFGAGARSAADCTAIGLDGLPGRDSNQNFFGGGGAAGGSFGGAGGAGGAGGKGNVGHGNPAAAVVPPSVLVGGCPGGHGGDGDNGGGGAVGGNAGGAIYLLAGDSIAVAGKIIASGAGGGAGGTGVDSSGGGGGGGAGGMIGLEASRIMVTGSLVANGGGGGGGGGGLPGSGGTAGSDPAAPATAAKGGPGGSGGGGGGGNGSVAAQAGTVGVQGSNANESAGGGGGGGAGVIRVFGVSPASLTGAISPPPT